MLNECVPRKLKRELLGFVVETVPERGWSSRLDGSLLRAADADGYDAFVTVDRISCTSRTSPHSASLS